MGTPTPHITAAELRIMKVLWELGSATVRQCLEALPPDGGEPPAYTTVMTMMAQLAEKGALAVDRTRQPYVYVPTVRRDQVLRHRLTQFLETVFDGQAEDLVLHLVEQADLSAEDLRRIEAKIQKHERSEARHRTHGAKRKKECP
jgi:predicted transcriptional regulator